MGSSTCNTAQASGYGKLKNIHGVVECLVFDAFLADLWGAYAIPLALSVVRRESSFVCRLCPP